MIFSKRLFITIVMILVSFLNLCSGIIDGNNFTLFNSESFNRIIDKFNMNDINIFGILLALSIIFSLFYRSTIYIVESEKNISAIIMFHSTSKLELVMRRLKFSVNIYAQDILAFFGITIFFFLILGKGIDITIVYVFLELLVFFILGTIIHILAICFLREENILILYYLMSAFIFMSLVAIWWRIYD